MDDKNRRRLWAAFALTLFGAVLIAAASAAYGISGGNGMFGVQSNAIRLYLQAKLQNEKELDAAGIRTVEIRYQSPEASGLPAATSG